MKKILLIEDDRNAQLIYGSILKANGYSVDFAVDSKEAKAYLSTNVPDLVLCDIMLPDASGIDIKNSINTNAELIDIPFIFLTALEDYKTFREGMDLGADGYLIKPVSKQELLKIVKSRLTRAEN